MQKKSSKSSKKRRICNYEEESNRSMWRSSRNINNRSKRNRRISKIDIEIAQVRISEIASNLPADLIVTTSKVKRDFGVPLITGMPFVSGLGVDKTKAKILEVLNK